MVDLAGNEDRRCNRLRVTATGDLRLCLFGEAGIPLAITSGADIQMVPELLDGLKSGRFPSLHGSRYFLFEPPHHTVPVRFQESVHDCLSSGYVPVITHPERLTWLDDEHNWQTESGTGIDLHWYEGGAAFGRELHASAVESLAGLALSTGMRPDAAIDLYIYAGYDDLQTAVLYEPENLTGKVPAILNVNGHTHLGKQYPPKQIRCINQAKRGMLALNIEWVGMGQLGGGGYSHARMNQLDLCGTSGLAPFFLSMKHGLDLLVGLPHADPQRLAVTGL